MKKNKSELIFILDKSGSMAGLESDTIGGYNAMLKKQQAEDGEATVTTVLFDDGYELLHDRIDIKGIRPISDKEYVIGGSTALLDAIGRTIQKMIKVQKNTKEDEQADKVMFVITTDGMENASREYTAEAIKKSIERQTEKYGWEFLFLGANIDAIETAASYGIRADRATNYHADTIGTRLNFEAVSATVSDFRSCKAIAKDWKKSVEEDHKKRNK